MKRRARIAPVLLAFIIVLLAACLIVGGCAITGYNRAVSLSEAVGQQWSQVDVVLQRRYDLIPNAVETVKGYAAHEKEIFSDIARSRERYFSAGDRDEKVAAAGGVERALSRLLALQERYPELKAQESFKKLLDQLEGSENRISVERRRYNQAVQALNTYCRSFLGRIFTGWAGVKPAEYFEADQQATSAPKIDFGSDKSP